MTPETLTDDMVAVDGGTFVMGSNDFYPEEGPAHEANVAPFEIDRHPVTNRQFAAFVEATGYRTVAERPLDAALYPALSDEERAPGSLVFTPSDGPVDLHNWRAWWRWVPSAEWRHPHGGEETLEDLAEHPVVHIAFTDAVAYAEWAGKRLPTETEWEYAARAGRPATTYAWGDEVHPHGRLMANTWQGKFPYLNTGAEGWRGTSPVGSFPANDFGLVDMIGNVWEWTSSIFTPDHRAHRSLLATPVPDADGCGENCSCGPASTHDARTASLDAVPDPGVRHVTKGGSHLCAPEYCLRYRPAARSPQTEDSATTHLGFRCARDR